MEMLTDVLKDYLKNVDQNWNYILPTELYQALGKDPDQFFLLDVRKPEDFKRGHIKGSTNIFWLDLMDNLNKLPTDKKIVLICYVGHTTSQVLVILRLLGYDVVALKFGLGRSPVQGVPVAGWLDYGYPLEVSE
jgi:rhodanese-related sulfurtransferase